MTNEPARYTDEVLPKDKSDPDIVWGMEAIGREINRTPKEVSYLLANTDLLNGVVKRVSHKITIASKRELRDLAINARPRD
jgi:hypothetical protein